MKRYFFFLTLLLIFTGMAQAALFDRGRGLIYDDVLDVTWLQDANYAVTSGYAAANQIEGNGSLTVHTSGRMGLDAALQWADNLIYEGYDDWRLPDFGVDIETRRTITTGQLLPSLPGGTAVFSYEGSDGGELSHMYHNNLNRIPAEANLSIYSSHGRVYEFGDVEICAYIDCSFYNTNGPFENIVSGGYWYDYFSSPTSSVLFNFSDDNVHGVGTDIATGYAWAVRSGDVTIVPIHSAFLLFISGGIVLSGFRRKVNNIGS